MLNRSKGRFAVVLGAAALSLGVVAGPAAAAPNTQEGLVNVLVEDVTVQVPITVAANVCDVNVAVLAQLADDARQCTATADSTASAGPSGNSPSRQEGLVNVLLDDIIVQVPVAVAANICDVNVAVLADVLDDASACQATADSLASKGGGGGNGGSSANAAAFDPFQILADIGLSLLDNDTGTTTGIPIVS
jgi:hypothetical protein